MVHKHKGVLTSSGSLRPHDIERKHSEIKVKIEHNKVLTGNEQRNYMQPITPNDYSKAVPKPQEKQKKLPIEEVIEDAKAIQVPIDEEGYLSLNLDNCNVEGVKITFSRMEGRKFRQAGLKIDNQNPSRPNNLRAQRLAVDIDA